MLSSKAQRVAADLGPAVAGSMLDRFACLAASVTGTAAAIIGADRLGTAGFQEWSCFGLSRFDLETSTLVDQLARRPDAVTVSDLSADPRFASDPLVAGPQQLRFLAQLPLASDGAEQVGFLCVLDTAVRPGLTEAETASLRYLIDLVIATRRRERRHVHLMHVSNQALRADRILRLVNDAESCTEALVSMLEELCRFHDAALGQMWERMGPEGAIRKIGQFSAPTMKGLNDPVSDTDPPEADSPDTGSSDEIPPDVAAAIRDNEARLAVLEDGLEGEHSATGSPRLGSQISVPIWLKQQRFAISLSFPSRRVDLDAVLADITGFTNTIRPALFRKISEEQIRHVAHHDELTGLANRLAFQEQLHRVLSSARPVALLYLDLDGFKAVNDTCGHEAGDQLLAAVAVRLHDVVGKAGMAARVGGDEFAVLQASEGSVLEAEQLARRLVHAIRTPFEIGGQQVRVGVSIGLAISPGHGNTADALLRNADTALYSAKDAGRNTHRVFDPAMETRQQQHLLIKRDLDLAQSQQQFSLAYQPICDAESLEPREFEALLRWDHPVRGRIDPADFVPLAESTGAIISIGRWALETACQEATQWPTSIGLSVNLSPIQFCQPDLPRQIMGAVEAVGLDPHRLHLEVTEGLLLDDSGVVLRNMHALREQGVRMTLDDFGTAYAGLSYLRRFPFDRLKVDRSFVSEMCHNETTSAMIDTILSLGTKLNLSVVAEGVETIDQLVRLRTVGYKLVQGFLTGRPMPASDARTRVSNSGLKLNSVPQACRDPQPGIAPIRSMRLSGFSDHATSSGLGTPVSKAWSSVSINAMQASRSPAAKASSADRSRSCQLP